ncbi:hypothetical protein Poli38472_008052 [Pythium oligandrum]|uniref:Apple domain-containing protein n=1 Tax=Pythium oligandrum TaxID=41045 RepID=A0A8K1CLF4_PYTOL|nr:hypothetical protein Poli38472_008052 [Pythium oligandrum]|eukprot:TMW65410.1 hypothetical protein Poli38472_008052 [Pythium oligandrum]
MKLLAALSLVVATAMTVDASSLRSVEDAERRLAKMEYMAAMSPPLNCFIENGFDYIGYDIKSVQGQAVENCCGICFSTNGCRAYSWTNQNGGTCWLKNGRGDIVPNPNVKSALFFIGYKNPTCQLASDVDYIGNDIGRAGASNPGQCCDICQKRNGCRAYTWTNQDGGTCWLKSKRGSMTYKAGAKSADAYPIGSSDNTPPPTQAQCNFVKDVDFQGNDIGNEPSTTPEQCCTICKNRSTCKAFTWSNHQGGTCWLKNGKTSTGNKPGVVSAVVG